MHILAVLSLRANEVARAIELLEKAAQIAPRHAAVLGHLGVGYASIRAFDKAIACFRRSIEIAPREPETLYNFARTLHACGQFKEAIDHYRAVLAIKPGMAEVHFNLGNTLRDMGRLEEAAASYRESLRLHPTYIKAGNNLGSTLRLLKRFDESVQSLREVLRWKPNYFVAHHNLGLSLAAQRRFDEAIASHRRALEIQPGFLPARVAMAKLLTEQKRFAEAVAVLDSDREPRREYREAYLHLADGLRKVDRLDEALIWANKAVQVAPSDGMAHHVVAAVLQQRGDLAGAEAGLRRALELRSDLAESHNDLGVVLQIQGRHHEAIECFEAALWHRPTLAIAQMNLAVCHLRKGDYERGWHAFEWRRHCPTMRFPRHVAPVWDGTPRPDATILLQAEQGLGDTIQFIRYAPLVRQRCRRVVLRCPRSLQGLLANCPGIDEIITDESRPPKCDHYLWTASLPYVFRTRLDTIPAEIPYVFPDPQRVEHWRTRLAEYGGLKVGIAWQGNPKYGGDRYRSIPLRYFTALARVPGVTFFSLQKGSGTEQIEPLRDVLPLAQFGNDFDAGSAFCDTAAIMQHLDLIISSDTAIPHLAGAMGRPAWLAIHVSSDWRWHDRGDACRWYPTLRLFRQEKLDDWQPVFERIADALTEWAASASQSIA